MKKRWVLKAAPLNKTDALQRTLADEFNGNSQRYWLKSSADDTARFYREALMLPLRFYVLKDDSL